jgi:hypothetical protein
MKSARILAVLWIFLLLLGACSSAYKETQQRKNFMMPHKSELPRNNKYTPTKHKQNHSKR